MRVVLAGHLLLGRQDRFDGAEVDVDHPRVRALLDDAGDDVALTSLELAEHLVVADVAQTLVDDLLGREGGDAAEVVRALPHLSDHGALVVEFGHEDAHRAALAVELDARLRGIRLADVLEIRGQNGLLDDPHELVEGDFPLALHQAQHAQVDIH